MVLDASAYLRSTQRNVAAIEIMREYIYGRVLFHAPPHFFVEVANVLRKSIIAGRESTEDALLTLNAAVRLKIEIDHDLQVTTEAFDFAMERGISAYDASYAIVALRREATLVTADAGLAQAAQGAGVAIILIAEGAEP